MKLPRINDVDAVASGTSEFQDAKTQLGKAIEPALIGLHGLGRVLRAMSPTVGAVLATLAPVGMIADSWARVGAALAQEPARLRERLRALVHRGWFIDPGMPISLVRHLHEAYSQGQVEGAETVLADYYNEHAENIVRRICEQHPTRALFIDRAFQAHRQGQYELSVPVFLIQADGLANDLKDGRQLYSKNPDVGVKGLSSSAPEGSMEWVFLSVYAEDSPLVKKTSNLGKDFVGLNRHRVLHGTDMGYATQINSLRALSTLGYAAFALAAEDKPELNGQRGS